MLVMMVVAACSWKSFLETKQTQTQTDSQTECFMKNHLLYDWDNTSGQPVCGSSPNNESLYIYC